MNKIIKCKECLAPVQYDDAFYFRAKLLCPNCYDKITNGPELLLVTSEREMLLNLLAVIHRDGGHYSDRHGLMKSYKDAEIIINKHKHNW